MNNRSTLWLILTGLLVSLVFSGWIALAQKAEPEVKKKLQVAIKPQHITDAVRAVIASDREVYARIAAERAADKSLPSPCELFRLSSEATASKGVEFSYVLRSLQPVRPRNAPETGVEKKGLELVAVQPGQPHYAEELLGGRWSFTAVYPDIAVNQSCVSCHNQLPDSPKKDYKVGDVMGGVVIRVSLEL